jgi:hypothetical protein
VAAGGLTERGVGDGERTASAWERAARWEDGAARGRRGEKTASASGTAHREDGRRRLGGGRRGERTASTSGMAARGGARGRRQR